MTLKRNQPEKEVSRYLPRGKTSKSEFPWLWLGTWSLGGEGFGPSDSRDSLKVLEKALACGIRHIDTAGFYAHGESEKLVAKVIGNNREEIFISSKGGLVWEGNRVLHRAGTDDLRESLMKSLDRLKTDYIDLFQVHWPDPTVPLSESIGALKRFQKEGLIRFYGVGNLTAKEVREYIEPGMFMPHQVHFNPIHQSKEILAAGRDRNRCCNCVVSPLEQGLLAYGRSSSGLKYLGKRDIRNRNPHFHSKEVDLWLKEFQRLSSLCAIPRVSVVLLWILAHNNVDVVIPGPRTEGQLDGILDHLKWITELSLTFHKETHNEHWVKKLRKIVGDKLWSLMEEGPCLRN